MRLVMSRYWTVIFLAVGTILFVGCNQQAISDTSTCPPPAHDTPNNLVNGQGWITNISTDAHGKWLITIDLVEYEGDPDPLSVSEFHKGEGELRIGLPDVMITGLPSTAGWSAGAPIFFSGMTEIWIFD